MKSLINYFGVLILTLIFLMIPMFFIISFNDNLPIFFKVISTFLLLGEATYVYFDINRKGEEE